MMAKLDPCRSNFGSTFLSGWWTFRKGPDAFFEKTFFNKNKKEKLSLSCQTKTKPGKNNDLTKGQRIWLWHQEPRPSQ